MVELPAIPNFDLNPNDVKIAAFLSRVYQSIWVIDIDEINMNILINSVLELIFARLKLLLESLLIFSGLVSLFGLVLLIFFSIWLFRVHAFHDIIMEEVKKVYLLL